MISFPAIQGVIDRRILVNYRVEPKILARLLPEPFLPKMVEGYGVAGVCLIRLREIRPRWLAPRIGFASENAAHRIAVHWKEGSSVRQGVYIPRRDTSSRVTALLGGRAFPGKHHHASYQVFEREDRFQLEMKSDDGETSILLAGKIGTELPNSSIFRSLDRASCFFEEGSMGYSARAEPGQFDGLELKTHQWKVEPLDVDQLYSSYFDNPQWFPEESAIFDHALLMRGIEHEWHSREPLYVDP